MGESKIHLSQSELDLVCNAELILTKNTIIKKAIELLSQLQNKIIEENKSDNEIFDVPAKISKGENYLGLPYAILDYPRIAQSHSLCFIRSMFWWGNFFSSTLHISGIYKDRFIGHLKSSFEYLSSNNYLIGIHNDPWQHHFEEDNYKEIKLLSKDEFDSVLHKQEHIKIAAKFPLNEWNLAANKLYNNWKLLTSLIA